MLGTHKLQTCEVQSVCELIDMPDKTTDIKNNDMGCNSEAQVDSLCPLSPPTCTTLTTPLHDAIDVNITTQLSWHPAAFASGYKVSIGTSAGGTEIQNNLDIAIDTFYQGQEFPCGDTIFITIIPYNDAGMAMACAEKFFYTESVVAIGSDDVSICQGDSTMLSAANSTGTHFSWSPTEGLSDPFIAQPMASPDTTTTYILAVSNDGRCEALDSVVVTVSPALATSFNVTDETGNNAQDGVITVSATGGIPPLTYLWSNDETTTTIDNLPPGTYAVTVTDAINCVYVDSTSIVAYVCPVITIVDSSAHPLCYNACDGHITISPHGGTEPYSYVWNTGQQDSVITDLCAGMYSVTIADAKNCIDSSMYILTEPDTLMIGIDSIVQPTCNGNCDGIIAITPIGGIGPYELLWNNVWQDSVLNILCAGTYSSVLTDANGCTDSIDIVMEEPDLIDMTIDTLVNALCYNACDGSISITASGGSGMYSYLWSNNETGNTIDQLCPGEIAVLIEDQNGCSTMEYFTIQEPEIFIVVIDSVANIINNALGHIGITIIGATDYSILWEGPNGFVSMDEDLTALTTMGCYQATIINNQTQCMLDTTICIETSSIGGIDFDEAFHVYPNPFKEDIVIDYQSAHSENIKMDVYNFLGQRINSYTQYASQEKRFLHFTDSKAGMYYFVFRIDDVVVSTKKVAMAGK